MERHALNYNVTLKKLFQLHGSNPHTVTFGTQADISNLCHFGWYECVYDRDQSAKYLHQKECLGRCLGPAKNEGNIMANWVLIYDSEVIPYRSIRRLKRDESSASNEVEAAKRAAYTENITRKLGDSVMLPMTPLPIQPEPDWNVEPYGKTRHQQLSHFKLTWWMLVGNP